MDVFQAPTLQRLSNLEQQKFAIEACLLCYGILDPDDGEYWRDLRWLTWRSRNNVVLDLRGFFKGSVYSHRRLAHYFDVMNLISRPLDDFARTLQEISDAIAAGELPPSDLGPVFAPIARDFCCRDRYGDGWINLWGDDWQ